MRLSQKSVIIVKFDYQNDNQYEDLSKECLTKRFKVSGLGKLQGLTVSSHQLSRESLQVSHNILQKKK